MTKFGRVAGESWAWSAIWPIAGLAVVLALRLGLIALNADLGEWIVPPGGDPAIHIGFVHLVDGAASLVVVVPTTSYPAGFHLLASWVGHLLGLDATASVFFLGILSVAAPILGTWWLASRWFDRPTGLVAAGYVGLLSTGLLSWYVDGNYPNLIASGLLLPLSTSALVLALRERRWPWYAAASLLILALIAFIHHWSFAVTLGLQLLILLGVFVAQWFGRLPKLPNLRAVALTWLVALPVTGFIVYSFANGAFLASIVAKALTGQLFDAAASFTQTLAFNQYPEVLGWPVWLGGLLGLIFLVTPVLKLPWERRLALVAWAVGFFLLSQSSYSALPQRLARELLIPLSVAGAVLTVWMIRSYQSPLARILAGGLVAIFIVLSTPMLTAPRFQLPTGLSDLVWFGPIDQEKVARVRLLPAGAKLVLTPGSPYYETFITTTHEIIALPPEMLVSDEVLASYLTSRQVTHVLDTGLPSPAPDPALYPHFAGYAEARARLWSLPEARIIETFDDGTSLYEFIPPTP